MIPINIPQIGEEEIDAVVEVMRKGPLTNALGAGPVVTEFEKNFAQFANAKYAVAVNTGTAALHAAVVAAGVKSGDEVILPSFTFVATAEAVVLAGAKPIFADIDPQSYNLDPSDVEKALAKKTHALLPVDIYGLSADMKPLREIADAHDLVIIEDAAQAHGLSYQGNSPGTFAEAACWSFYASKNMTTGEGGIITTNSDSVDELLRKVRTHGEKAKYTSQMLGCNYRMSEIQAAIGKVQLKKLPTFLAKRQANARRLNEILGASEKLHLPEEPRGGRHSWYLYTVRLLDSTEDERNRILEQMHQKGIGAEAYYVHPLHTMPYYREAFESIKLPETEKAAKQVMSLPIHPGVTEKQIDYIGDSLLQLI